MEHQNSTPSDTNQEDRTSGIATFFGGIGLLAGMGLVALAIWFIFGQRFTFYFMLPAILGAGLVLVGIYRGLKGSSGPAQLLWRLTVFSITLAVVGWSGVYAYSNTIGAPPPAPPAAQRLSWSGSAATALSSGTRGIVTELSGQLTNRDSQWSVEQVSIKVTPTVDPAQSPVRQLTLPAAITIQLDDEEIAPGETAHYSEEILVPLGTTGFDEEIQFAWHLK